MFLLIEYFVTVSIGKIISVSKFNKSVNKFVSILYVSSSVAHYMPCSIDKYSGIDGAVKANFNEEWEYLN